MPDNPDELYWPINFDVPWLCQQDSDCAKWLGDDDVIKCGALIDEKLPIGRDAPNEQELISFDIIGFNNVP